MPAVGRSLSEAHSRTLPPLLTVRYWQSNVLSQNGRMLASQMFIGSVWYPFLAEGCVGLQALFCATSGPEGSDGFAVLRAM